MKTGSCISFQKATSFNATYQLGKASDDTLLNGISIVDLFRFEKVVCSPRLVENVEICSNSLELEGGLNLMVNVTGKPWHDYYVRKYDAEYSKIALIDINRKNGEKERAYLMKKPWSNGSFIVSQISTDPENEKNIRIYAKLLANLGACFNYDIFSYVKGDRDYSIDYLMTLPYEEHKDYKTEEEYFSDGQYSLNNLGEGLYGWMKKVEKDVREGYISIPHSKSKTYFLTCFPILLKDITDQPISEADPEYVLVVDANCLFKLWINGSLLKETGKNGNNVERVNVENIRLADGLNRLAMVCKAGSDDIRIRLLLKNQQDGSYADNVRYKLTIDEVDPK